MSKDNKCLGLVPNTFIVCGENGNYCSQECYDRSKEKKSEEASQNLIAGDLAIISYDLVPYWATDANIDHPAGYLNFGDIVTLISSSKKSGAVYWYCLTPQGPGFIYEYNIRPIRPA